MADETEWDGRWLAGFVARRYFSFGALLATERRVEAPRDGLSLVGKDDVDPLLLQQQYQDVPWNRAIYEKPKRTFAVNCLLSLSLSHFI